MNIKSNLIENLIISNRSYDLLLQEIRMIFLVKITIRVSKFPSLIRISSNDFQNVCFCTVHTIIDYFFKRRKEHRDMSKVSQRDVTISSHVTLIKTQQKEIVQRTSLSHPWFFEYEIDWFLWYGTRIKKKNEKSMTKMSTFFISRTIYWDQSKSQNSTEDWVGQRRESTRRFL